MKYFIFDLDGTLIDTEQAVLKTWQKTLQEYGYARYISEIRCVLGVTTEISLKRLNVKVDDSYVKMQSGNCFWFGRMEQVGNCLRLSKNCIS